MLSLLDFVLSAEPDCFVFAADVFACFTIGSAVVVATFVVFCIPGFFFIWAFANVTALTVAPVAGMITMGSVWQTQPSVQQH